jgi:hypothetical protein
VGFVTRHQVQEIAVHHWDVAHAIGRPIEIEPEIAGDAVDEFLTVSISSAADPADPPRPALAGSVALVASDLDRAWTVSDDSVPGTVLVRDGVVGDASTLRATSQELLLWLYGRCELTDPTTSPELTERLRALSFTN